MDVIAVRRYGSISIHAPRVGSDLTSLCFLLVSKISIHAPRVGSDLLICLLLLVSAYFNPRSPRGERQ